MIAADHGGVELKDDIVRMLAAQGVDCEDLGTRGTESVDYPDYAAQVADRVSRGEAARGILVCGTGIGMAIAANKFAGVRAALVHDTYTAKMSREHNDANVLVLGGRVTAPVLAEEIVRTWLATPFEGGRHARRVEKIGKIEEAARKPR